LNLIKSEELNGFILKCI